MNQQEMDHATLYHHHLREAIRRFPGPDYYQVLSWIHAIVRPRQYIEIGVNDGSSLKLASASTRCIGIDPLPLYDSESNHIIIRCTSDDFFKQCVDNGYPDIKHFSLGFIDGLHSWIQVLEDFINLEYWAGPSSLVMIHDCIPLDPISSAVPRKSKFHTGDVWKAVVALVRERQDLSIAVIPTAPSGLALIKGLDPTNARLLLNKDRIHRKYVDLGFVDFETCLHDYPMLPNDYQRISDFILRAGASRE